jgi:hypothetical protein
MGVVPLFLLHTQYEQGSRSKTGTVSTAGERLAYY